jgi:hypothetical protein
LKLAEFDAGVLTEYPTRVTFAERADSPDDFMTGHARIGDAGHEAIYGGRVGMADAAGSDAKASPARRRIHERTPHQVHFPGEVT